MLEDIIKQASEELLQREKARDETYSRARKIRVLSKQSILFLHRGETLQAEANLSDAKKLLSEVKKFVALYPELDFYDTVKTAKQEYSEASILYGLNMGKGYPKPSELGVSSTEYILGLADVPGELRRQTIDLINFGTVESAKKNLSIMEDIYLNLISVAEVSLFLKDLRRKLDVTRNVNERTRSEIANEVSREKLRHKLSEFYEKLK
jgi:translin